MVSEQLEIEVYCPKCGLISTKIGSVEDGYAILSSMNILGVAGDNQHCDCGYYFKGDDLKIEEDCGDQD